jgi:hypothetical protein
VEGAANYRQVPLIAGGAGQTEENEHYVYGTGWVISDLVLWSPLTIIQNAERTRVCAEPARMMAWQAENPRLRNALDKMGAGPNGTRKVMWTSLREEPVLVRGVSPPLPFSGKRTTDSGVVCQVAAARPASHRQTFE